jgi:uncharacterized protein (DUF3084 family)
MLGGEIEKTCFSLPVEVESANLFRFASHSTRNVCFAFLANFLQTPRCDSKRISQEVALARRIRGELFAKEMRASWEV